MYTEIDNIDLPPRLLRLGDPNLYEQLSLKVFKKNNFCLTDMLPTGPTSPCPEQLRALGGLWTCGYY